MMDFVKRIVLLLAFSSQLLYINVRVIFEIYFCINDVYVYFYYLRDAMLARVIEIATCLSVCPSRAGIVSKRRKLAA